MKAEDRIDQILDQALEMTFPASDPFTVTVPAVATEDKTAPAALPTELEVAL